MSPCIALRAIDSFWPPQLLLATGTVLLFIMFCSQTSTCSACGPWYVCTLHGHTVCFVSSRSVQIASQRGKTIVAPELKQFCYFIWRFSRISVLCLDKQMRISRSQYWALWEKQAWWSWELDKQVPWEQVGWHSEGYHQIFWLPQNYKRLDISHRQGCHKTMKDLDISHRQGVHIQQLQRILLAMAYQGERFDVFYL